jgi:hypothetical protein
MPRAIRVTPDNFCRAETDLYFTSFVKEGAFGTFVHNRQPTPLDEQKVVRMNRDTLYSSAVFDLDAGPVTITMPDAGSRFMSLQVWDEDEYCPLVAYGAGTYQLTREGVGTRFAAVAVRTLVDPEDPSDLKQVHALQDAITVTQPSRGTFEVPNWDPVSQKKVRDALASLAQTMPDTHHTFGPRGEVDPVRHLIGAAVGWGGNPERDAFYLNLTPANNDGRTRFHLHVPADVPVDGFWSISVYNKDGYFEPNTHNAYSVNNITAQRNADGSIDVQFGGCDGSSHANCIPITPGWNVTVRLYRPRPAVLDGTWRFPEPQPIE